LLLCKDGGLFIFGTNGAIVEVYYLSASTHPPYQSLLLKAINTYDTGKGYKTIGTV